MLPTEGNCIVEYEKLLDTGLREALALCEGLQREMLPKMGGRLASNGFSSNELELELAAWTRRFYELIGRTLLNVLRIMQPDYFLDNDVNFYLWPGYHSFFASKR